MAKQVLNLRSGVEGKQPTQDQLEYGQIAINYFKDKEKVFFKNTSNEVVDIIPSHEVDTRIATATNDMLTKTVADSTYQAQGDYVETNTYNADKATFALKTEIPSVNLSEGYTESSLSNQELEPKPNESFETAIGKLHKAIKDNEVVESTAFDTFRNSCGFDNNALYKPKNELISGTTSLSDAMEIVAENANKADFIFNTITLLGISPSDSSNNGKSGTISSELLPSLIEQLNLSSTSYNINTDMIDYPKRTMKVLDMPILGIYLHVPCTIAHSIGDDEIYYIFYYINIAIDSMTHADVSVTIKIKPNGEWSVYNQ